MTRQISFAEGEFYHVYNRGNSKQDIFLNHTDFERFKATLYLSNTSKSFNVRDVLSSVNSVYEIKRPDTLVRIGAYCLMPNHFHLVISPTTPDGLSKFMLKLGTSYSMYFNTRYERTGSLFEGRYRAKHADTDEYLKYLFSYIHLNPIAKKLDGETVYPNKTKDAYAAAKDYAYSSLQDYINSSPRPDLGVVDTEVYRMYFADYKSVRDELFDWLDYDPTT